MLAAKIAFTQRSETSVPAGFFEDLIPLDRPAPVNRYSPRRPARSHARAAQC
jgi:hypothetical protein